MKQDQFEALSGNDIVSLKYPTQLLFNLKTFEVHEFHTALYSHLNMAEGVVEVSLFKTSDVKLGWIEGQMIPRLGFWTVQGCNGVTFTNGSYFPQAKDLISVPNISSNLFRDTKSSLFSQISWKLRELIGLQDPALSKYYWLDRGIECEVLRTTGEISGWQSGLVRIQLEFLPKVPTMEQASDPIDDSISPLDSLRA
jgi:KGK domain